ncbi:MAG: photosynthetic complex putative assembly protein PuhB [Pseudomonadota bacterium]
MKPWRAELNDDLPGQLPRTEQLIWRGGPDGHQLARHALHVRKLAVYFALVLAWRLYAVWQDGGGFDVAFNATLTTVISGVGLIGGLYGYAIWAAKNTTYTITTNRIVMRTGIALSVTINLPFSKIDSADIRHRQDGGGDIELTLTPDSRASYFILWPNVKRWNFWHPRPLLRVLRNVDKPAELLSGALAAHLNRSTPARTVAVVEKETAMSGVGPALSPTRG